jgi:hypothetical protein
MPTANIQRRKSIEQVYPPDAFASDAVYNGQVTNEVILGVRILSAPNDNGDFVFERSSHHVGEVATPTFLAPHRREERLANTEGDPGAIEAGLPNPQDGYVEFLDDIVVAAQRFGFERENSPGQNEPGLQGFRAPGAVPDVATCFDPHH